MEGFHGLFDEELIPIENAGDFCYRRFIRGQRFFAIREINGAEDQALPLQGLRRGPAQTVVQNGLIDPIQERSQLITRADRQGDDVAGGQVLDVVDAFFLEPVFVPNTDALDGGKGNFLRAAGGEIRNFPTNEIKEAAEETVRDKADEEEGGKIDAVEAPGKAGSGRPRPKIRFPSNHRGIAAAANGPC